MKVKADSQWLSKQGRSLVLVEKSLEFSLNDIKLLYCTAQ